MTVASIDIGTNTVILLIASVNRSNNSLQSLHNEYRMPRIGKGLEPDGEITEEKLNLLFPILTEYKTIIEKYGCEKTLVSATNAFRLASNSKEISTEIKNKFNFDVNIISGGVEADYAFLGALSGTETARYSLVIDIGGGSTELIFGNRSEIFFKKSYPIGSVIATEKYLEHTPPLQSEIEQLELKLEEIFKEVTEKSKPEKVIAIAGTPTTLACMVKGLKEFEEAEIDGSDLTAADLQNLVSEIKILQPDQIKKTFGNVLSGREDIILGGALILKKIMEIIDLDKVMVSSRGIRYGAIIKYLKDNFKG
jgi:exopolyphosphatase/guanosine-5'-triphosphate,3'-diphosphate pyrophosphatase